MPCLVVVDHSNNDTAAQVGRERLQTDPAAALPPRQPHLLPVLGPTRPPGHHDLLLHHRRAPLAGRDNLPDRQGRVWLGPNPGPQPGRDLPAHRPDRPRPAPRRRHPQHDHRQHHPASRHRHDPTTARRTPAPRPAATTATTATATATARSATPTADPPRRRARPGPRRPTLPTRTRPDQAVHRRNHPADRARRPPHHRADHPRPTRLRAALVTTPTTPPGQSPLAPLQHPAPSRHRNQIGTADQKEVTRCSHALATGYHSKRHPSHAVRNLHCSTRRTTSNESNARRGGGWSGRSRRRVRVERGSGAPGPERALRPSDRRRLVDVRIRVR